MSIFILKLFQQSYSKMKLSLVFLAVLGVATAASIPSNQVATKSLADDLDDFLSLVTPDADKYIEIAFRYLAEDEEVQSLLIWLTSDEAKSLILDVEQLPEYIAFLDYLQDAGLDVYKWVDLIHELLGLAPLSASTRLVSTRAGGIAGLVNEILALLPRDELRALHEEKLQTSEDYAALVEHLASPEFQVVVKALQDHPTYQKMITTLTALGVPVAAIIELGNSLIGLA